MAKAKRKAAGKKTQSGRRRKVAARKKAPARPKARRVAARRPPAARQRRAAIRPATPAPADKALREFAKRIVDLTVTHDDEASFGLYADNVESVEMGMPPTSGIEAIRQ